MKTSAFHNCLALHMRCAEPVRIFAKPSRWKRWLPVWLVPLLGLIALSWDWARLLAP